MQTNWLAADFVDSRGPSADELAARFHLPAWIAKILWLRAREWNSHNYEDYTKFLSPSLKDLPDPFGLPDMDVAVDRIIAAIDQQEKIVIYADYDVDGTVSGAIIRRFFRMIGVEAALYQPDRHKEGYGINKEAIKKIADDGAELLISVDCGIRAVDEVEYAKSLGLDVIITDHHEVGDCMPASIAVVDHKREDNTSPIHSLCGAGTIFYVAIAIRARLRELNWFAEKGVSEPDLRKLMDLVAVATVADLVPLIEENRSLVAIGLDKLRKNPSVGLQALCTVAGVDHQKIDAMQIGFVIGPRINAAGRLGSAKVASELLVCEDPELALEMARELDSLNRRRMKIQNEVFQDALEQAEIQAEAGAGAIVVSSEKWHEGVIGIVASKLLDRFQRPTIVLTKNKEKGEMKGSARSIDSIDLMQLFGACSETILQFGGHAAAAGLSVAPDQLEAFRALVSEKATEYREEPTAEIAKTLRVDATVEADEITLRSINLLQRLGPFGMANEEPVISINGCIVKSSSLMKEKHLKLQIDNNLKAIWFNHPTHMRISEGESIDILFTPQRNEFRGNVSVDLHVKDIRLS